MSTTRSGVCYELGESPYTFTWRGLTYHFSSETHRRKFKSDLRKREEWLRDSLTRRFKVYMCIDEVADLQLYTQVETRGFYVITNDGAVFRNSYDIPIFVNRALIGVVDDAI